MLLGGLGSADTITRDVLKSSDYILDNLIAPHLREAVRLNLPITVGLVESQDYTEGRCPGVLVMYYTPLMDRPLYLDFTNLNRAADNVRVRKVIKDGLVREGLLTLEELIFFYRSPNDAEMSENAATVEV